MRVTLVQTFSRIAIDKMSLEMQSHIPGHKLSALMIDDEPLEQYEYAHLLQCAQCLSVMLEAGTDKAPNDNGDEHSSDTVQPG